MIEQGTPEWLALRAGHVSASVFKDVLAKTKTGEAAVRKALRLKLVTERLTGQPVETYKNGAMEWGTNTEPLARLAYEAKSGNLVEEEGFLLHPTIKWVGCSPDGLIDSDGGLEIKCPFNSCVHVQTLEEGMPPEHKAQVQGAMWVTGRDWWDFVSFDPRMPAGLQLHIERVIRDVEYIKTLEEEVVRFLGEVEADLARLLKLANERK